jgi:hypothetical protein
VSVFVFTMWWMALLTMHFLIATASRHAREVAFSAFILLAWDVFNWLLNLAGGGPIILSIAPRFTVLLCSVKYFDCTKSTNAQPCTSFVSDLLFPSRFILIFDYNYLGIFRLGSLFCPKPHVPCNSASGLPQCPVINTTYEEVH